MGQHFLASLFAPRSVAVFGASDKPDSVGGRVFDNLMAGGFPGPVFAINPRYTTLKGGPCFADLATLGQPVDLAIIATPAQTVPVVLRDCGTHGVRAVIVITAGFRELGPEGAAREDELVALARQFGIRMLGPNCLGLLRPPAGMNASFSKSAALPGRLALISQSGAMCTAILDWAEARHIGFSALVSLGAAADTGFGDLLDFFAQDKETDSILLYVEGIRHARLFIEGLRRAASLKPVIILKAGRHAAGSRAATTHTGALVGADAVFDAVLRRSGVVRVQSIEQLFAAAQLLSSRCLIDGRRLAILTNGGGLGVMAVDRAMDLGIELAALSADTITRLNACMPAHWSHDNPVDILGDASANRYSAAMQAIVADDGADGVLVMLSPQAMTDIDECARVVAEVAAVSAMPVLTCWMGGAHMGGAKTIFRAARVPHFDSPEAAVEAFSFLAMHCSNQRLLQQATTPLDDPCSADVSAARVIVEKALAEGRSLLDMLESKALLRAFDIPVWPSVLCRSSEAAVETAGRLGYPVVLKIHSRDISHKSDVGGVRLNIGDAQLLTKVYAEMLASVQRLQPDAVVEGVVVEPMHRSRYGRELMVGMVRDPVFGPAISFGAGGTQVEIWQDRAIALPPLDSMLIEDMISRTRVAVLLGNFRGMPAIDCRALHQVMKGVSRMVCELPELGGLDINPLVADENGVIALDARIELARIGNVRV